MDEQKQAYVLGRLEAHTLLLGILLKTLPPAQKPAISEALATIANDTQALASAKDRTEHAGYMNELQHLLASLK